MIKDEELKYFEGCKARKYKKIKEFKAFGKWPSISDFQVLHETIQK